MNATQFSVTYTLNPASNPGQENFDTTADLTLAYLQSYFEEFFSQTPFSTLINFSGTSIGNTGTGDPASIGFEVTTVFSDDSDVFPSQADIDVLIDTALSEPAVFDLINQLQALGVDNPFSNTESVEYATENVPTSFSSVMTPQQGWSTIALMSTLATLSLAFVSIAGFVSTRRRRQRWRAGYEDSSRGTKDSDCSTRDEEAPSSTSARTVCSGFPNMRNDNSSIDDSCAESLNSSVLFEEATKVE